MRHVHLSARRKIDLSSSYLEDGPKCGLNRTALVQVLTYYYALDFYSRSLAKINNFHRLSRHEARTAEAASGRVGRGEQGEARPRNSAARGGP